MQPSSTSAAMVAGEHLERSDASRASQLQAALDHAPDAFVSMCRAGRITEWNLQAARMFGWERPEALGRPVAELIVSPRYRDELERGLARYLLCGEWANVLDGPFEMMAQGKDGRLLAVELTVAAVRSGPDVTFNAFVRDIGERRASELALREADALFRAAFTHASVGMCLATLDEGRWTQVNPALCALLGYRADQLVGIAFDAVTHPADVADNLDAVRRLRDREISVYETEKRYIHRDGHVIWVSLSVSLLCDAHDTPRCFIAHVLDISERKACDQALLTSERQLAEAQALGDLGSWEWDLETDEIAWSSHMCRIAGFAPGEHPRTPDAIMALVHEQDRAALADIHARSRGGEVSASRYRLVRPDGEIRWIHGRRRTTAAAGGRPTRMSGTVQDVTDRVAAEDALRDAEERFRRSFDEAAIGMAVVSLDGRWTKVNDALCAIVGYTQPQLTRLRFQDITHPHDLDADEEFVRQLIAGERSGYQMYKRYLHAGGNIVWVQLDVSLVRDAAGEAMYFIAQIRDITDERERRLQRDRERRALTDAQAIAQIGSWSWEPETDLAEWSDETYRIFGRDPAEGPATAERLFAYVCPADRDRVVAGYAEAFGAGAAFELEFQIVAPGGEVRSLHVLGRREAAGRYVGTAQDVTELSRIERSLKDAEQLLALAFDHSPLGMSLTTPDRRSLRINKALADMLGYSVAELMAEEHPTRFTHPDDRSIDHDHVRVLLDGDGDAGQWDKRFLHADGHSVWARVSVSLLRHPDGSPRHLVSQIEDISERRQGEAEQRALRDVAERVAAVAEPAIVFGAIAEHVRGLVEAGVAVVMRFDAASHTGVVLGGSAAGGADLVGTGCDLDSTSALAEVFRTGRPARVEGIAPTAGDPLGPTVRRHGLTSSVAAPIHVAGRLWGAVGSAFAGPHIALDAETRLEPFAHLASLAMANLEIRETLEHRAATDPLTGIANHRAFHDRLGCEVQRARRHGRQLSVVLFDLDDFKAVNDTHGHQTGDRILTEVARRISAEARDGELVARIGGEEFAWLIPEADRDGALAAAERVRRTIESSPFAGVGTITVSAGVCPCVHGCDAQWLMRDADRALYWAKEHGRNNTVVYNHRAHTTVARDDASSRQR